MSMTDNIKLIVRVCEMYYDNNMSQKEISAELGMSRPQVCRMIAAGREQGIVNIAINNPYSEEAALESALKEKYGLEHAFVVKIIGATENERQESFARVVGSFLSDALPQKGRIGVSNGRIISSVAQYLNASEKKKLEFIPLMGGMNRQRPEYQSNQIAQSLATQTGSIAYSLNAPLMVQNAETKKALESEPSVSKILDLGKRCDVTILGVEPAKWTVHNAKPIGMNANDVNIFKSLNAAVSICTNFFDKDGNLIKGPLRDRIIAQHIDDIKDSKTIEIVIGPEKAEMIIASLKSGYIKMLMTDESTARKLI